MRTKNGLDIAPRQKTFQLMLTPLFCGLIALLSVMRVCTVWAQQSPGGIAPIVLSETSDSERLSIVFELEDLLFDQQLLNQQIADPVWLIEPSEGRVLIQVPVRIRVDEQIQVEASAINPWVKDATFTGLTLDDPVVGFRGGRFIGWRVINQAAGTGLGGSSAMDVRFRSPHSYDEFAFTRTEAATFSSDVPDAVDWINEPKQQVKQADLIDQDAGIAYANGQVPYITRRLFVLTDGRVAWEMDRALPGIAIKEQAQSNYLLKIRPDKLQALMPERPQRTGSQRGSNNDRQARRAQQQAEAQAQADFRDAQRAYVAMRKRVMALPDRFVAQPDQGVVYAVFEVSQLRGDLTLSGVAPLPWTVDLEDLELLRQAAGAKSSARRQSSVSGSDEVELALARILSTCFETENWLGAQLVAFAMESGQMGTTLTAQSELTQMVQQVIAGPNAQARHAMVKALASVPPTPVTTWILSSGLPYMTPEDKLAALSGLLTPGGGVEQIAQQLIDAAMRFMKDPSGPNAGRVLEKVAARVNGISDPASKFQNGLDEDRSVEQTPRYAWQGDSDLIDLVGRRMNLQVLPDGRLEEAALYVTEYAHQAVESVWLDTSLLSWPLDVVRQERMLAWLAAIEARPHDAPLIPIAHADHGMLGLLKQSEHLAISDAAWSAIGQFQICFDRKSSAVLDEPQTQIVEEILIAGLQRDPVPVSLAQFAAGQLPNQASAQALVRMVVENQGPASQAAAFEVVASQQPIAAILREQDARQNVSFAERVYEHDKQLPGALIDLLRSDQGGELANWFGDQVAAGRLPDRMSWAMQAGGESRLLGYLKNNNSAIQLAASDGLVALIGGDPELAGAVLANLESTEIPIEQAWQVQKKQLFAMMVSQSAGLYRLVLNVYDQPIDVLVSQNRRDALSGPGGSGLANPYEFEPDIASQADFMAYENSLINQSRLPGTLRFEHDYQPAESIEIGTVELIVDGQELRLSNGALALSLPTDHLAIRVASVRDLRHFDLDALMRLPLSESIAPVDLLPQSQGVWMGRFELGQGTGELRLEPIED